MELVESLVSDGCYAAQLEQELTKAQSMATSLPMRTSSSATPRRVSSPWPIPAKTPTAPSSSSPPLLPRTSHYFTPPPFCPPPVPIAPTNTILAGWTASTSSSARSSRATRSSRPSRTFQRATATSQRRLSRLPSLESSQLRRRLRTLRERRRMRRSSCKGIMCFFTVADIGAGEWGRVRRILGGLKMGRKALCILVYVVA